MEAIFENYELFIKEHSEEIGTPQGAVRMINDEGMFRSYVDSLTEGLDDSVRPTVISVLNREREMILQEAANVGASSVTSGWTVMSFPILVDIYSEPIIAELCNVYPVDKPIISIPRVRIKAQTKSYDGATVTEEYIPTAVSLVRANVMTVNIVPNASTNVFTATSLSTDNMKMNRRYTLMTQVQVTETDAGSADHVHNIDVNFRPDARAQISREFTFPDSTAAKVTAKVNSHIDYEKGEISFSVIFTGGDAGATFVSDFAEMTLRFTPVATMNGRTKVIIETEMTDITIDPNEDFLIDLTEEDVQDYNAIFKIDLLRTLSEAIKRQVLLNKDFDLAYFLKASETEMANNGAKQTFDLDAGAVTGGDYTPNSVIDILKNIVPKISTLISTIRRNYNMYPSYAVTGLQTASLLRSLQDMMTNIPNLKGEMGFSGATSQFMKLKVLESTAIDDNKIYLSTKAPQNALEKSSIIDLIFKPLYIVKEITDGNTRHFVRARTMIEISRTDGMGFIECVGLDKYLGSPVAP